MKITPYSKINSIALLFIASMFGTFLQLNAQDAGSMQGKYRKLLKEIKLSGREFKSLKKELKEASDWGLHEQLQVGEELLPKGYWVYAKESMPQVSEKTTTGVKVSAGLGDLFQMGKSLTSTPVLYIWAEETPNWQPPAQIVSSSNGGGGNFSSQTGQGTSPYFKYELWIPSQNSYYDLSKAGGVEPPQISGTVKMPTTTYLFQTMRLTIVYDSFQGNEISIGIDGLGRTDMPMSFPLGAGAKAVVSGFTFNIKSGNNDILPISSEPSYQGTDNTGMLVISSFNPATRVVSGYFEYTCKTNSSTEKVRGTFSNITLKQVYY